MAEPKALFDSQDWSGVHGDSSIIVSAGRLSVAWRSVGLLESKKKQDSVSPDCQVSEAPLPCKQVVLRGRLLAFVGKQLDDCLTRHAQWF